LFFVGDLQTSSLTQTGFLEDPFSRTRARPRQQRLLLDICMQAGIRGADL